MNTTFGPGERVRLVRTSDRFTALLPGERGTVIRTDTVGTVHIAWDTGSRLGLVPHEDTFTRIGPTLCSCCRTNPSPPEFPAAYCAACDEAGRSGLPCRHDLEG